MEPALKSIDFQSRLEMLVNLLCCCLFKVGVTLIYVDDEYVVVSCQCPVETSGVILKRSRMDYDSIA